MQSFNKIYQLLTHRYFLIAIVATVVYGAYYGMAAVSIPSVVLAFIAVLGLCLRSSRPALLGNKEAWMVGGACGVFLLSVLNSSNLVYWFDRFDHATAYLYIPLGIAAFRPIDRKTYVTCLLIFVFGSFISAMITGVDYLLNFNEYNELYNVGKTIPTPIIHVRYSFLLALASICGFSLLADKVLVNGVIRMVTMAVSVVLFLFIHVLAVRTGLVTLYGGLAVLVAAIVYREKKWKVGLIAIAAAVVIATVSILTVPSLKNKINYMIYDLKMFDTRVAEDYSDNLRITSMRLGGELFLENPLFGVGMGDVKDEMYRMYETKTPEIGRDKWFAPVSQIISWLAAFGLVGTVLISGFIAYPVIVHGKSSYLLVAALGCCAFSMLAETMFRAVETKAIILIVLCLTYEFVKDQSAKSIT